MNIQIAGLDLQERGNNFSTASVYVPPHLRGAGRSSGPVENDSREVTSQEGPDSKFAKEGKPENRDFNR